MEGSEDDTFLRKILQKLQKTWLMTVIRILLITVTLMLIQHVSQEEFDETFSYSEDKQF